ncbi:hypothetical protein CAter10_0907 [Collimonas arenae]|nr:hypothetical protein CAter10_0907 [Collimonas arenae]
MPTWLSSPSLLPHPVSNVVSNMDTAMIPLFFDAFMIYLPF